MGDSMSNYRQEAIERAGQVLCGPDGLLDLDLDTDIWSVNNASPNEVAAQAIDASGLLDRIAELETEVERRVDPEDCIHTHELDAEGRHLGKAVPRKQEEWAALWVENVARGERIEQLEAALNAISGMGDHESVVLAQGIAREAVTRT